MLLKKTVNDFKKQFEKYYTGSVNISFMKHSFMRYYLLLFTQYFQPFFETWIFHPGERLIFTIN